ncbi:hypothetical protein [Miltoncostaea oceani]|uniref:hypothetical protein n=1 Tax=Miltoncostaea oceani TaxID=2843216 RepID=UPI001C3D4951|nr:hypothetical protein [Miltoncostaea oceani]
MLLLALCAIGITLVTLSFARLGRVAAGAVSAATVVTLILVGEPVAAGAAGLAAVWIVLSPYLDDGVEHGESAPAETADPLIDLVTAVESEISKLPNPAQAIAHEAFMDSFRAKDEEERRAALGQALMIARTAQRGLLSS